MTLCRIVSLGHKYLVKESWAEGKVRTRRIAVSPLNLRLEYLSVSAEWVDGGAFAPTTHDLKSKDWKVWEGETG